MKLPCYRLTGILAFAGVAFGQLPLPKNNHYEVVSIKPGIKGKGCGYHSTQIQVTRDNCTVATLIREVYIIPAAEALQGMPKWASDDLYTLVAKSIVPANPLDQYAMMLPVLRDRFQLKTHFETRQAPVYFLSAASGGIKFPETVPGSCTPIDPNVGPKVDPDHPMGLKQGEKAPSGGGCDFWVNQRITGGGTRTTAKGITMGQLAGNLRSSLDRPIIDRTGTAKLFDIDMTYVTNDVSGTDTDPLGLPILFEALKKNGLVVTRGQGPVQVLIIDRLERPTEN